jgi:hypothetical protein
MSNYKCMNCGHIDDYWEFYADETEDGEGLLECPKCHEWASPDDPEETIIEID